jgi:trehalose 6-phosphate synthase/phosphatase
MRLFIIANRLPVKLSLVEGRYVTKRSEGGLATGLASFQGKLETHWIGWPGTPVESKEDRARVTEQLAQHNFHPIFLTAEELELYYEGYCNNILWPLCHYFFAYIQYDQRMWTAYLDVNRRFFQEALRILRPDDRVWIQDYQLMLLPRMLREAMPNLWIGYFHHIPFPSFELFRVLPERAEVLRGLLGADLIGFHTHDYMRHFISAAYRVLGADCDLDEIRNNGRLVQVNAFPMGINFRQFHDAALRTPVRALTQLYRQKFGPLKLVLSVDRLDYSKGVLHRLKGFALALETHPELRGRVSLVKLLVPSRASVPENAELKKKIDEMIGALNGRFATLEWTPVHYYYRSFSQDRLLALYHVADAALVTPLRDGMNLVAKEYVAAKRDRPGVLILSERAGAAIELTDALIVNPNSAEEICEAIAAAVVMPEEEQMARLERMQAILAHQDIDKWAADFLEVLETIHAKNDALQFAHLSAERIREIKERYAESQSRLLILDYDGTLTALRKQPEDAAPDSRLREILTRLSDDPQNTVVVSSGRDRDTLDRWLGDLPIRLAAEHGAFYKQNGIWYGFAEETTKWSQEVLAVMKRITNQTLGSRIEKKRTTLVWHYRNCDAWLADLREKQLINALMPLCTAQGLHIMRGNKVLEIKASNVNKGTEALRLLRERDYAFVLAMGDDVTDEDMFRALPPDAITIHIADFSRTARYTLPRQADVLPFLSGLANCTKASPRA